MNMLQLLIGITELVLAIISSRISCKATCCRDKKDTSTKSKIKSGPISALDRDKITAMVRQVDCTEEDKDAEAAVGGGEATVDPPRYADLAWAEDEEDESIAKSYSGGRTIICVTNK